MDVLNQVNLHVSVVWGYQKILLDLPHGLHPKSCFVGSAFDDQIGGISPENFTAGGTGAAGEGRVLVVLVFTGEGGGQGEGNGMLARTEGTFQNVGMGKSPLLQIIIKAVAKSAVSHNFAKHRSHLPTLLSHSCIRHKKYHFNYNSFLSVCQDVIWRGRKIYPYIFKKVL